MSREIFGREKETSLVSLLYGFVRALAAKTMLVAQSVRCEQANETENEVSICLHFDSFNTFGTWYFSPLFPPSLPIAESLYSGRHQRPLVAADNTVRHSNAHIKWPFQHYTGGEVSNFNKPLRHLFIMHTEMWKKKNNNKIIKQNGEKKRKKNNRQFSMHA